MRSKTPKYAYILAILLGLFVLFLAAPHGFALIPAIVFLISGLLFGFIWPVKSWKWGLWITGPLVLFITLSVLFAGRLDVFFKYDLPIVLLAVSMACLGSFISAWFRKRQLVNSNI